MIICGLRSYVSQLAVLFGVCIFCRHQGGQVVRRVETKFTLYFIPLFTTGNRYVQQCAFCAQEMQVSREYAAWAEQRATVGAEL